MTGTQRGRTGPADRTPSGLMTEAEFRALYERLRGQLPWGPDDRRGALNYLTPDRGTRRRGRGEAGPHRVTGSPGRDPAGGRQPGTRPAFNERNAGGRRRAGSVVRHGPDRDERPRQRRHSHRRPVPCDVRRQAVQRGARGYRRRARGDRAVHRHRGRRDRRARGAARHSAHSRRPLAGAGRQRDGRRRAGGRAGPGRPGRAGATSSACAWGTAAGATSRARGTRRRRGPVCTPACCRCWRSARSPSWAATATTTPPRARSPASISLCTCSPSTRWACT